MTFFSLRTYRRIFAASLILACVIALPIAPVGCKSKTAQRQSVNTIASLGYTVDAAFKSYLDLVISGKVPTNSVPQVATSYSLFQAAYNSALTISVMNTNAPPPVELQNAASQALLTIQNAKGK